MSQPPAPFPTRSAYSSKLPDRSAPSSQYNNLNIQSSQPQFGQSAPGFGRQGQFLQPLQQPAYGAYSQYASVGGLGSARGQTQAMGMGTEKESNLLNDLSDEQREEINEAVSTVHNTI